jgi:hypothetical protein
MHLTNPADYDFEVSNVTVTLETAKGELPHYDYRKGRCEEAGRCHAGSRPVASHALHQGHRSRPQRRDYTLLAQYNAPKRVLDDRKRFTVQIQETNGKQDSLAAANRTASESNSRSGRVFGVETVSSDLEWTILSVACQMRAKSIIPGVRPGMTFGVSHIAIVSYILRPKIHADGRYRSLMKANTSSSSVAQGCRFDPRYGLPAT